MSSHHKRSLEAIKRLRQHLTGTLILPQDDAYEQARRVWNGMVDKRPSAIVRCANEQDVIRTVQFAREQDLPLSVRGGGHDYCGRSLCDDGLVIDFSAMRNVSIDPERRTARVQAGTTIGELIGAARQHGLVASTGSLAMVGLAGQTLGGGYGPLMGKFGMVIDNLLSVDIVTAEGQLLTANTDLHPDLFWAVRGGGGNFGVVTAFEYRLHPGSSVLTGTFLYPLDQAREVLRGYHDFTSTAPDELTIGAALLHTPDGMPAILFAPSYHGSFAEGERAMEPLRTFGTPLLSTVQPMEYSDLLTTFNALVPVGRYYFYKGQSFAGLSSEAIEGIVESAHRFTSPFSALIFHHFHGAASRVGVSETAFALRQDHLLLEIFAGWEHQSAEQDQTHLQWTYTTSSQLAPFAMEGVYINLLDSGEQERLPHSFGPNYARLVELKRAYDPGNVFHSNPNIQPGT